MVVGAPAAVLIGLLIFMLIDFGRDRVISALDSIHVSLPSFTKARPETSPLDGPTGPEADALAERVRSLYGSATSVNRQIPLVNNAYRDAPALYKSQLEQEKQRSGRAIAKTPDGQKPTAMQIEEQLERQHQKVTTTESDFRNNLASVMAGVEKIAKACSKLHAARNAASSQLQACDAFDGTVSALRVQTDIALDRLKSAEQEYQKARQAINEIEAANLSTPSPAPVQAKE